MQSTAPEAPAVPLQVSVRYSDRRADKNEGLNGTLLQVRLLGEYHKGFAATEDPDGKDIDDPLYGNANGPEEQVSPKPYTPYTL